MPHSLAGASTPQLHALIERRAGDETHIGRELDVIDQLLVAGHARYRLLVNFRLPQKQREVVGTGDEHLRRGGALSARMTSVSPGSIDSSRLKSVTSRA